MNNRVNDTGLRVGVDVGGTFTDVCLYDGWSGKLWVTKVPTNPGDQAESVLAGTRQALQDAGSQADAVRFVGHGTTVALNALLERKGARIAFLTTRGFRDVLELGRQQRPELYNFFADKAEALAPRHFRYEVDERTLGDGTISEPVTARALRPTIRALRQADIQALAIGFLNAYRNPENEQQAKRILEVALPGLAITCSHEIAQEFREFERFSSAAMNAYLLPKVSRYLTELSVRLKSHGVPSAPLIFQSNGAVVGVPVAARNPIRTLISGPAAGVLGAAFIAAPTGFGDVITFDMGGTSTDVSLIENGTPSATSTKQIGGYPVLSPSFDVRSIGAGGGSIAWVDAGGFIKVGPQSAGADPGPACYGRGGTEVTVTDADMVLGYLSSAGLLGGKMRVDRNASQAVIDGLAKHANLDRWTAAAGVVRIVSANIARLVRLVAFERGREPRDFTLVAYGGAGPLHAGAIARELGIRRILVPAYPGLLCALGMLVADLRTDFSKTFVTELNGPELPEFVATEVVSILTMLETLGQRSIREGELGPSSSGQVYTRASFDLRYKGQNYEITVPAREGRSTEIRLDPGKVLAEAVEDFHQMHERIYGHASRESVVQLVTIRLGVGIEQPKAGLWRAARTVPRPEEPVRRRRIRLVESPQVPLDCVVLRRETLRPGEAMAGPAIIEQMDSTILILPGQEGFTDPHGNLVITERGS